MVHVIGGGLPRPWMGGRDRLRSVRRVGYAACGPPGRVLEPTSPLSVGFYVLAPFSAAAGATAAVELLGWFPRLKRFGGIVGALFGGPMATYTAVLLANTAVPSWRDFGTKLPFVFAGSAMAGGEGCAWSSPRSRRPVRPACWP